MHRNIKIDRRLKIACLIGLFISLVALTTLLVSSDPGPGWVYQENANATACTGTWHATQTCALTYDGNWSTYGQSATAADAYAWYNYTKVANATNSSLWQVKDEGATINLSIPIGCWNQTPLQFQVHSEFLSDVEWLCYNGTGWRSLRLDGASYVVYEEAIWWNVTEAPPVDTCTCAGVDTDWEIDMADFCNITTDCNLGTGTLSFTGTGATRCNATINTTSLGDPGANGMLYILNSCIINID